MRESGGRNAPRIEGLRSLRANKVCIFAPPEMDVTDDASVRDCVFRIESETDGTGVIVHNVGHMCQGLAEAFTPEDYEVYYDVNALSTQRVNRAALPATHKRGKGLLVWVSSSSTAGGTSPFLAPYFAAKAAMDSLAKNYATELSAWSIETSIVVPGVFTSGTNHFLHAGKPSDPEVAEAYMSGPLQGVDDQVLEGLRQMEPADANPEDVARVITRIVGTEYGKRPVRVHVDPSRDGGEEVMQSATGSALSCFDVSASMTSWDRRSSSEVWPIPGAESYL